MADGLGETRRWELLVLDVDGVLTDGTKLYDRDGKVFGKAFNDKDFTAIKRFQEAGVRVCLLSGDRKVTEAIARKRNIDFYCARQDDGTVAKAAFVDVIAREYDVAPQDIVYVGDDHYDLEVIARVGRSFCPSTAPNAVKKSVTRVLSRSGGDGLIAELYDVFESH